MFITTITTLLTLSTICSKHTVAGVTQDPTVTVSLLSVLFTRYNYHNGQRKFEVAFRESVHI